MVLQGGTHNSAATHRLDLIDDNIGDPDALFRPCVKSGWDRAQCSRAVQPVLNPSGEGGHVAARRRVPQPCPQP
jgi:hypothetical protein